MKKQITTLLIMLAMMVSGMTLSYAAFPVASQNQTTQTAGNNSQLSDEAAAPAANHAAIKASVSKAMPGKSGKSQVIALLLVCLVGSLGIHRFYLGYTWQGVVQLLTLGGCGIWTLIDLIRIITGSLGPKDGRYAKTF